MFSRKPAAAALKVTADVVAYVNAKLAAAGSPVFCSSNTRGTLTYFRRYSNGGGYSISRTEWENAVLFLTDARWTAASLVDEAFLATLPEVPAHCA